MKTIKIFLASSYELKEEREQFEIFINRKNKDWLKSHDTFLHLDMWEDFNDAMSLTRLQDEYNKVIKAADIFVVLLWNKVGIHVTEEFEKAFGQFKETAKPFIYTYFKIPNTSQDRNNIQSLWAFEDKLEALGHYKTRFENTDGLKHHFSNQLDKLFANHFTLLDKSDSSGGKKASFTNFKANEDIVIKATQDDNSLLVADKIDAGGGIYINVNQKKSSSSKSNAGKKNAKLSILQYIKSNNVSIENEIRNLKAGGDINVIINDFIMNSPDYKLLQERIKKAQRKLENVKELTAKKQLREELENLYKLEKEFKVDILRLADIFSRMEVRTERLRQARQLFEEGKFKEADAILKEEDLASDQFNLIIYADYLEFHLNNIITNLDARLN